jgi:hypothetical protein
MKLTRLVILVIALIGSAAVVRADGLPVDPKMDVSDPTCTTESCPNPVGPNQGFQFTVVPNSPGSTVGGGVFMATNNSAIGDFNGQWNSLLFTFATSDISISCTSGAGGNAPFLSPCTQSTEADGTITDLFYTNSCIEGPCPSGITPNDIFTISLNDLGVTTGSWPVGLTFTAYPNQLPGHEVTPSGGFVTLTAMPEPATLTLLGIGIGALLAKQRFRGCAIPRG